MRKTKARYRLILSGRNILNTLSGILVELLWVAFLVGVAWFLTVLFFK